MPPIPPVPSRPTGMRRKPSANTKYMQMLLDLDSVPKWHNVVVAIAAWMLLAGFVIFPGTFASMQSINDNDTGVSSVEGWVLHHVRNLPLLVVGGVCCGVGALVMTAFWLRWRRNYVWVCNRVFLPGTLNAAAGLISTLINVYTAQSKQWSITARVSAIVEGACLGVCGALFLFYSNYMLERVKRRHNQEFWGRHDVYNDESIMEKMKRKATEPSPEPGRIA